MNWCIRSCLAHVECSISLGEVIGDISLFMKKNIKEIVVMFDESGVDESDVKKTLNPFQGGGEGETKIV